MFFVFLHDFVVCFLPSLAFRGVSMTAWFVQTKIEWTKPSKTMFQMCYWHIVSMCGVLPGVFGLKKGCFRERFVAYDANQQSSLKTNKKTIKNDKNQQKNTKKVFTTRLAAPFGPTAAWKNSSKRPFFNHGGGLAKSRVTFQNRGRGGI